MFKIFPIDGGITAAEGFFADGINCGLKKEGFDLAFFRSEIPCDVAAVFTTNRFAAAPVVDARKKVKNKSQFMLINSKNANAMTGEQGFKDIEAILADVPFENPMMCSTGVIGSFMPVEKIKAGIKRFDFNVRNGHNAAKAIMTTDRWDKQIAFEIQLESGESFRLGAMAKGAGMIAPNMATMLCYVTTDAQVERPELQGILERCIDSSFNAVSVDGDMSTNDSVFVYANGMSGAYNATAFEEALRMALHHLALEVVRDGEGATKLVAFEVSGAVSDEEAKKAAKMISNSLLVKTALFGQDPNWGRLAMAVGASGITCDESKLIIKIGNVELYKEGVNLMSAETEAKAAKVMQNEQFRVTCHIGLGEGNYTAYGCDLGYEYVKINADYRT